MSGKLRVIDFLSVMSYEEQTPSKAFLVTFEEYRFAVRRGTALLNFHTNFPAKVDSVLQARM